MVVLLMEPTRNSTEHCPVRVRPCVLDVSRVSPGCVLTASPVP